MRSMVPNFAKRKSPIGNIIIQCILFSKKTHRYANSSLNEALVKRGTTVHVYHSMLFFSLTHLPFSTLYFAIDLQKIHVIFFRKSCYRRGNELTAGNTHCLYPLICTSVNSGISTWLQGQRFDSLLFLPHIVCTQCSMRSLPAL